MQALTVESIAEYITKNHEAEAVEFINSKARQFYGASYSRGTYGRLMLPLIKKHWPRLNLNGQSTSVALAITGQLERKGYGYKTEAGAVSFR